MATHLSFDELMEYTDWERQKWFDWLRQQGEHVLKISAGPHGDGRFATLGELIKHVFSAEKRYVDRLSDRPLTDTGPIPADKIEALDQLGRESRAGLREFIRTFPAERWETPNEYKILAYSVTATPRKIIAHVLMHEIRHWAQIAALLRLNGLKGEFHDFLGSPVLGGGFRREEAKA